MGRHLANPRTMEGNTSVGALIASAAMDSMDDLRLAFDAYGPGGGTRARSLRGRRSATLKADGTPVTEADRAVERLLRETLSQARPDDAFLGEELGRLGESDRVWILDPIDGTGFFSRGDPNWRIHIALEVRGTTEVAVVTSPALRRCWWATRGGGSFESSWPRAEAKRGASRSVRRRRSRMPCSKRWTTSPGLVSHRCGSRPGARCRWSNSFVARSTHSWPSAASLGSRAVDPSRRGSRRPFHRSTGGSAGDQGGGLYSNAVLHSPNYSLHSTTRPERLVGTAYGVMLADHAAGEPPIVNPGGRLLRLW